MEQDILDRLAEDEDGFDPLAPIEFDEDDDQDDKGEDQNYYVDKIPEIAPSMEEAAAARRAKYPTPELTRPERIAKAIKGMPGQKKLLLHVIAFCEQERPDAEIIDEIHTFQRGGVNVYAPESVIAILERCGALELTNDPLKQQAVASSGDKAEGEAGVEGEPGSQGQAEIEAEGEAKVEDASANAGKPEVEGAPTTDGNEGTPAGDPATHIEGAPASDGDETLRVSRPEPARYRATADGLAAVAQEDPAARFTSLMEANAVYAPIFRTVLEICESEGGATKKQIDQLVDHDPLCQEPRRFSGYFIDKLEEADGIVFESTWHITETGRAMLEADGIVGALC